MSVCVCVRFLLLLQYSEVLEYEHKSSKTSPYADYRVPDRGEKSPLVLRSHTLGGLGDLQTAVAHSDQVFCD